MLHRCVKLLLSAAISNAALVASSSNATEKWRANQTVGLSGPGEDGLSNNTTTT